MMTAVSSTASLSGAVFVHDREPPREWVQRLAEISPPSDVVSQLMLVWESGEVWGPWQRWSLYQCVKPHLANPEIVAELRGPNPRSEGHMCSEGVPDQFQCLCREKWEMWRGGPCDLITLTQWKLYQRTGLVGYPFWIIQGDRGGHKAFFSKQEKIFLAEAGKPTDPPVPGELAYAPFDERVVSQILRYNQLMRFSGDLRRFRKAMGPEHAQYVAEQDRAMRADLVRWMTDGFLAGEEDVYRSAVGNDDVTDLMERKDFDIERVEDEVLETFIETGRAPDPETLHQIRYGY